MPQQEEVQALSSPGASQGYEARPPTMPHEPGLEQADVVSVPASVLHHQPDPSGDGRMPASSISMHSQPTP